MHWRDLILLCLAPLTACGPSASEQFAAQDNEPSEALEEFNREMNFTMAAQDASSGSAPRGRDRARVCRAAIADLNGHSPSIVKLISDDGEVVRVRYSRPSDGKVWTNECRFDGGRVVWRSVDAFGAGTGVGRWRSSSEDELITFVMKGDQITISTQYPDGSGGSEQYTVR